MRRALTLVLATTLMSGVLAATGTSPASAFSPTTVQCNSTTDTELTVPGKTAYSSGDVRTIIVVADSSTVGISACS